MNCWPAKRTERLIELHAAGMRPPAIAAELKVGEVAVAGKAQRLGLRFGRRPVERVARPLAVAPDVLPLVERALAEDPAGAARVAGCAANQLQAERSWPLHLAAYVGNVELGYPTRAVGRAIGRAPRLVRYAVRRIEDRRDEPAFDAFLERLGDRARELAA